MSSKSEEVKFKHNGKSYVFYVTTTGVVSTEISGGSVTLQELISDCKDFAQVHDIKLNDVEIEFNEESYTLVGHIPRDRKDVDDEIKVRKEKIIATTDNAVKNAIDTLFLNMTKEQIIEELEKRTK